MSALPMCRERVTRLLLMLADEQQEVQEMREGNIVVAVGLKHVSLELRMNTRTLLILHVLTDLHWGHPGPVGYSVTDNGHLYCAN